MHGGWLTDQLSSLFLIRVVLTVRASELPAAFTGDGVPGG